MIAVIVLTQRELDYLYWTLLGKTAWEAATILGTSESAAAKMLRSASAKLGTKNKSMAAIKADQLGFFACRKSDGELPSTSMFDAGVPEVDSWPLVWMTESDFASLRFEHVLTVALPIPIDPTLGNPTGYGCTTISANVPDARVGIQWNWVESGGIVVMENPMGVISNLVLEQGGLKARSLVPSLLTVAWLLPWRDHAIAALAQRNLPTRST